MGTDDPIPILIGDLCDLSRSKCNEAVLRVELETSLKERNGCIE